MVLQPNESAQRAAREQDESYHAYGVQAVLFGF